MQQLLVSCAHLQVAHIEGINGGNKRFGDYKRAHTLKRDDPLWLHADEVSSRSCSLSLCLLPPLSPFGCLISRSLFRNTTIVPFNRPSVTQWRVTRVQVRVPLQICNADECAGGAGCEYIRVRHRDDPEAELFLFRDGLVLYGCEDPINRWRGAGVTLLPAESARVREVSRHEVLQVMQRLGLRRDPPPDLHLYKLGLPESKPLDGPFDPENPPPWAVYYRNFKDRTEPGFWGEYQHHEDPGWQEYVLRCWDKDSASEEDSDGLGRLPPVLVSEEANEREEAMHVFPRKSKRLPRHASHPVREGVGLSLPGALWGVGE